VIATLPPLNLARQPVRNDRLGVLGFGAAAALIVVATLVHAVVASRLVDGAAAALSTESRALELELQNLRERASQLRSGREPAAASTQQWASLKTLVDQKAFSWTALLARLEAVTPPGVRLVSIAPSSSDGRFELQIQASARTTADALKYVKALEDRPEFESVFPLSLAEDRGEVTCSYSMVYRAELARSEPGPAPEAEGPGDPEEPVEDGAEEEGEEVAS
jgi:hypothetical protein